MDPLRHLSDMRPAAFGAEVQTAAARYRRRREENEHESVLQDLYLTEHRLVWKSAGESGRLAQHELRQFSAQLMAIQEKERKRIAADLHDGIGQSLSLIKLSMESVMQLMMAGRNQQAIESMQRMVHRLRDAMAELRRATTDLHPPMLDDLGIIPTMTWFLREFESACPDKKVELDVGISESQVPGALKATIFRILQEAMNNIVKHADAGYIRVSLNKTGSLVQFAVEDNGQGFDQEGLTGSRRGTGFGLVSMKERAISSHGAIEIESAPGKGTRILVTWPADVAPAGPAAGRSRGGK